MFTNNDVNGFFGIVALSIVGRDKAEGTNPGQDFKNRLRHWGERLEADPYDPLTPAQERAVERLAQMLIRKMEIVDQRWDEFQSWPHVPPDFPSLPS